MKKKNRGTTSSINDPIHHGEGFFPLLPDNAMRKGGGKRMELDTPQTSLEEEIPIPRTHFQFLPGCKHPEQGKGGGGGGGELEPVGIPLPRGMLILKYMNCVACLWRNEGEKARGLLSKTRQKKGGEGRGVSLLLFLPRVLGVY